MNGPTAEHFAVGLAVEANRQGVSPAALADAAHVTTATVTRILDGTDTPCPTLQQRLAAALHTTPASLYRQGTP